MKTETNKQHHNIRISRTIYVIIAIFLTTSPIQADNLNSPSFNIQMGTINMTGGNKSSTSYKLGDTVGQTFQGKFDSAGFIVKAGFQYINSIIPFTFVISDLNINLGTPIPGFPNTASHNLTVTNGSAFGYTVRAIENHPLKQITGNETILNTSCDPGTTCTTTDANIWTGSTTYGFGYNMAGQNIDLADFVNSTYFRPFPNALLNEAPAIVMQNQVATKSATATVTYKVNISGAQAAGIYQNFIQYLAIPSY